MTGKDTAGQEAETSGASGFGDAVRVSVKVLVVLWALLGAAVLLAFGWAAANPLDVEKCRAVSTLCPSTADVTAFLAIAAALYLAALTAVFAVALGAAWLVRTLRHRTPRRRG